MTPVLSDAFLRAPIAHRGYHGGAGGAENSREAIARAVAKGYGIELDLQLSADGQAMVFHDETLARMTGKTGRVIEKSAAELGALQLIGGHSGIPTLAQVLAQVSGDVPLLLEVKDQSGVLGPCDGRLEQEVAALLGTYGGPAAVMSFNPNSVAYLAKLAPGVPRGLTTDDFSSKGWPDVPKERLAYLRRLDQLQELGACFISHDHSDLKGPSVTKARAAGLAVLCWTIETVDQENRARQMADNITFEGYAAQIAP